MTPPADRKGKPSHGVRKPDLIVDVARPYLPPFWSLAGLVWSIVFLSTLEEPHSMVTLAVLSLGVLLLSIARISATLPAPRSHPATLPVFLFLLALLIIWGFGRSMAAMLLPARFALPMLTAIIVLVLVRSRRIVLGLPWLLLLMGIRLAVGLVLFHEYLPFDRPGVFATNGHLDSFVASPTPYVGAQLILLAVTFPWIFALRHRTARVAGILFAALIVVLSAVAPFHVLWRSGTLRLGPAQTLSLFGDVSRAGLIAFLLFLVACGYLVRQTVKERRRWRGDPELRALITGGGWGVVLLLVLVLLAPRTLTTQVTSLAGIALGLSLAARERLIYEDPTRHPRRRPTPLRGHLEELQIMLRSVFAGVFARVFGGKDVPAGQPRRLIDASGTLFTPYRDGEPRWVPFVFHMHSNRWEGAFTPEEMVDHYARLGAGAVIVTDHNRVTRAPHAFGQATGYEHGWGPHHHHILALGTSRALVDRYPFNGPLRSRMETLARLRKVSQFLVLAHPKQKDAWSREDVIRLDYDAVELFNKSVDDTERWDQALGDGLLVWGTAGDDCHDLRSRHQTGKRYLLLDLRDNDAVNKDGSVKPSALYEALQEGRFVAVLQKDRHLSRRLPADDLVPVTRFTRDDTGLTVEFAAPVDGATVIGPGGKIIAKHEQRSRVTVAPEEGGGYARLQVTHGVHTVAFNPVARLRRDATLPFGKTTA